jgi:uncharacterized protein (DUF488 family)
LPSLFDIAQLPAKEIFTVGHSTRSIEAFLKLLHSYEIGCLIDVRSVPKSRRVPHFGKESLERALRAEAIDYLHLQALGGWRRPVPGSPNAGWRSKGFQGYADHMATDEFEAALARVAEVAGRQRSALMCAEALWWRCHRMLISDALTVRGWRVRHVGGSAGSEDHELTSFAVKHGERLTYPPPQQSLAVTSQQVRRGRRR